MERLSLTPKGQEIIVNNGSTDGAVDLFSYGPEMEPSARTLGSLFVLGWRQADTNTMGYMVSLIAALARREYYSQPSQLPKEAFARTLRKINEVVEEFFKSEGVDLAVGIFAVAGGTIMVSKLEKFKVLLARDGEVIDILNNISLFNKEHLEKRRFSSIISGSIQAGDRLLAYYPAKNVVARERAFKGWLLSPEGPAARLAQLGQEQPAFAASFVQVDITQTAEPAQITPEPLVPSRVEGEPEPTMPSDPTTTPSLAWAPRQQTTLVTAPPAGGSPAQTLDTEQEVPHIIPTEFSLGTRQSSIGRAFGRLHLWRLDGRGKAIVLAVAALVIAGGVLTARSLWFTSPQEEKTQAVLAEIAADLTLARSKEPTEARTILVRALSTLSEYPDLAENKEAEKLSGEISAAMDGLDNAESANISVLSQLDPKLDRIVLATWASSSASLWAVTTADDAFSVIRLGGDGLPTSRVALEAKADILLGHGNGALVIDADTRIVYRVVDDTISSYAIPTQESVLDATVYADTLYLLTDKSILKISDLETRKPVTKQWLTDQAQLAPGAAAIRVDGSVYTLGRDGMFTTYYKGTKSAAVETSVKPSGNWRLVPTADPLQFAVANADRQRVYAFTLADGALTRTLKLDSQQPLVLMAEGPDNSVIAVTKDNRIWKLQ